MVADIDATDGDGGLPDENVLYEIEEIAPLDPNYPTPFEISSDDGVLKAAPDAFIDRNIARSYTVAIEASDKDGATERQFVINVLRPDDPPGIPAPIGPFDEVVNTRTPTYSWGAVPSAVRYQVWVNDALGKNIRRTFGQRRADCLINPVCDATPSVRLAQGTAIWWVRASNSIGEGQWSDGLQFSVQADEPPDRPAMLGPEGTVQTSTPELVWTERATATWYLVKVRYRNPDKARNLTFEQWYRASEVNCGDGNGKCSLVMPVEMGNGPAAARVLAANAFGESRWSRALRFSVSAAKSALGDDPVTGVVGQTQQGPEDWSQRFSADPDSPAVWDVQAALSSGCAINSLSEGSTSYIALWDCAAPIVFAMTDDGSVAWSQPALGGEVLLTRRAVVVFGEEYVEHFDRLTGEPLAPPARLDYLPDRLVADRFGGVYAHNDYTISAIEPGHVAWTYESQQIISTGPVFAPNGDIHFGTVDGSLFVLDQRGNMLFEQQVALGNITGISVDKSGTVLVRDEHGGNYEIEPPVRHVEEL